MHSIQCKYTFGMIDREIIYVRAAYARALIRGDDVGTVIENDAVRIVNGTDVYVYCGFNNISRIDMIRRKYSGKIHPRIIVDIPTDIYTDMVDVDNNMGYGEPVYIMNYIMDSRPTFNQVILGMCDYHSCVAIDPLIHPSTIHIDICSRWNWYLKPHVIEELVLPILGITVPCKIPRKYIYVASLLITKLPDDIMSELKHLPIQYTRLSVPNKDYIRELILRNIVY